MSLLVNEGVPVEFCILPGSFSDVAALAHLPLALPAGAEVAADAAYTFKGPLFKHNSLTISFLNSL
jgi:hypothetical protein